MKALFAHRPRAGLLPMRSRPTRARRRLRHVRKLKVVIAGEQKRFHSDADSTFRFSHRHGAEPSLWYDQ